MVRKVACYSPRGTCVTSRLCTISNQVSLGLVHHHLTSSSWLPKLIQQGVRYNVMFPLNPRPWGNHEVAKRPSYPVIFIFSKNVFGFRFIIIMLNSSVSFMKHNQEIILKLKSWKWTMKYSSWQPVENSQKVHLLISVLHCVFCCRMIQTFSKSKTSGQYKFDHKPTLHTDIGYCLSRKSGWILLWL